MTTPSVPSFSVTPIGVLRTPFSDRASAPRQAAADRGTKGLIELHPDPRLEHALEDLNRFRYIWVLYWFHLNEGWKPKVRPPRSAERRGLFATRSPYRPNPIGMSVVELEKIEGRSLHVVGIDMLDETPVLDIKPYIPYADSIPDAGHGWLEDEGSGWNERPSDPRRTQQVEFASVASVQLAFLSERGIELGTRIEEALALGAAPHPYRRIRKEGEGFRLAVRDFRAHFRLEGDRVIVERLMSGYRPSELFSSDDPALEVHRAFVERFGADGERGA